MKTLYLLAFLINLSIAKDLNIGVFSDVHLALNYNPDSSKHKCKSTSVD